jgi:glycosyltransferase involved in cell wall biosynthesis
VIDDAFIDGTSKILKKYIKKIDKLITHKINKGKGAAIKNSPKIY